ncbi:hypothetical protein [Streptomyces broussonetiae]|uniref:Uncharacterized protein n=1 Tax=Streptomyces broussonetiae TaxID=2686304 RepID=A0ABV5E7V7_9ACTN
MGLWGSLNAWLRDGRAVPGRRYWGVSAALLLGPTAALAGVLAAVG